MKLKHYIIPCLLLVILGLFLKNDYLSIFGVIGLFIILSQYIVAKKPGTEPTNISDVGMRKLRQAMYIGNILWVILLLLSVAVSFIFTQNVPSGGLGGLFAMGIFLFSRFNILFSILALIILNLLWRRANRLKKPGQFKTAISIIDLIFIFLFLMTGAFFYPFILLQRIFPNLF